MLNLKLQTQPPPHFKGAGNFCSTHMEECKPHNSIFYNIVKKLRGTYLFKYLTIQRLPSTKILSKPVLIVESCLGASSGVMTEKVPKRPAGPGQ